MDKPLKQYPVRKMYDYHKVLIYLEKKYKFDSRDYESKYKHFEKYISINPMSTDNPRGINPDMSGLHFADSDLYEGYEGWTIFRDKDGKKIQATKKEYDAEFKLVHKHYQEYLKWTDINPIPEYLDFWHWVITQNDGMNNGSEICICMESVEDDNKNKVKPFIIEIMDLLNYEGFMDEEGYFTSWVKW